MRLSFSSTLLASAIAKDAPTLLGRPGSSATTGWCHPGYAQTTSNATNGDLITNDNRCIACPAGTHSQGGVSSTCTTMSDDWATCSHVACKLVDSERHCNFHSSSNPLQELLAEGGTIGKVESSCNDIGEHSVERISIFHHGSEQNGMEHKCSKNTGGVNGARGACECQCRRGFAYTAASTETIETTMSVAGFTEATFNEHAQFAVQTAIAADLGVDVTHVTISNIQYSTDGGLTWFDVSVGGRRLTEGEKKIRFDVEVKVSVEQKSAVKTKVNAIAVEPAAQELLVQKIEQVMVAEHISTEDLELSVACEEVVEPTTMAPTKMPTAAPTFTLTPQYKASIWCGPSDGMITSRAECVTAAGAAGIAGDVGDAGSEWHAGCIINNGKAYYVPYDSNAAHDQPVNNGYLCNNVNFRKQDTYCGPGKGMITTETGCKIASEAAITHLQHGYASTSTEWNKAGCIINGGKTYFVAASETNSDGNANDGGYLCSHDAPKAETGNPTAALTKEPTKEPTQSPTKEPTQSPTKEPTQSPTKEPTQSPTKEPTQSPTKEPTQSPTKMPTAAPTFTLTPQYKTGTWCAPSDGLITSVASCQGAAADANLNYASQAGTNWRAGCIIHGGSAYFVADAGQTNSDGEGGDPSDGGYLCNNVNFRKQAAYCGPSDGMIATEDSCKIAAEAASNVYAHAAGTDWKAGCIIHGGKAYFVPDGQTNSIGDGGNPSDGGYLCSL